MLTTLACIGKVWPYALAGITKLAWKDDGIAYSPNSFVEPSLIGDLEV